MRICGPQECRVIGCISLGMTCVTCCRGWYVIRRLPGRSSAIMTTRANANWDYMGINGVQECREIYGVEGSVTGNTIR